MIAKRIRGARNLRSKNRGFIKLLAYLEQDHKLDSSWYSPALGSAEFAGFQMQMIATLNRRVENPMYHLALSWGLHENPSRAQMEASTRAILEGLGFDPEVQQWIAVSHKDAMHHHVHLVINRVNPVDLRVVQTPYDYYKLSATVRSLEERFGWTNTPGVAEKRQAMPLELRLIEPAQIKEKVKRGFGWSGRPAFQEWISVAVGEQVYRHVMGPKPSWDGVHQILAGHSLRYVKLARGGAIYDPSDPELRARASHLGRFASLPNLEKVLGPFTEARAELRTTNSYRTLVLEREPALLASPLYDRFIQETGDARREDARARAEAWRLQHEAEARRRAEIHERRLARMREIMTLKKGVARRPLRFKAMLDEVLEKQSLATLVASERIAVRAALGSRMRVPTFKSWLSAEAKAGNVDALSLLAEERQRRYVYKHFFERVPELTKFLKSVTSRSHAVQLASGKSVERPADELLTRRGERIRPTDPMWLTLSGITDETLVSALGAVYAAREDDRTISAIFRTDSKVDGRKVARALSATGCGNIRIGTVPYPGFGHDVRVAAAQQLSFVDCAEAFINARAQLDPYQPTLSVRPIEPSARGDRKVRLPQTDLDATGVLQPIHVVRDARPKPKAGPPRWIRTNEKVRGVCVQIPNADPNVRAIQTRTEIVLFRSARPLAAGAEVSVTSTGDGYGSIAPTLTQPTRDISFPTF